MLQEKTGDLHRLQCENDLDYLLQQSNFQNYTKAQLNKLGVDIQKR